MTYFAGDVVDGISVLSGPVCVLPRSRTVSYVTACSTCGRERMQQSHAIAKNRNCISCSKKKHGLTTKDGHHPLYQTWVGMRSRCERPADTNYKKYGAKGIYVCDRWSDFLVFLEDMGERPSPNHSIDRIDGSKGYEPGNCRWASHQRQQRNLSSNRLHWYLGRGWNLHELASHAGMEAATLGARIRRLGWSVEASVTTPLRRTRN